MNALSDRVKFDVETPFFSANATKSRTAVFSAFSTRKYYVPDEIFTRRTNGYTVFSEGFFPVQSSIVPEQTDDTYYGTAYLLLNQLFPIKIISFNTNFTALLRVFKIGNE